MEDFVHSTHFIENENIHEITVGSDPRTDIRLTVGQAYLRNTPNEIKITAIEVDQNAFVTRGVRRILIFAETKGGEEKLWKILEDIPVSITCKL